MATENPRFTITVSDNLFQRIEDYQFKTRQKNRNIAVTNLLEVGLGLYEGNANSSALQKLNLVPREEIDRIVEKAVNEAVDGILDFLEGNDAALD